VSPQAVDLGCPIKHGIFLDDRFAESDGKLRLYTTASGHPCLLNVYNLTDDILEETLELAGSLHCWSHAIDPNGLVYVAPMDPAKLFRYDPAAHTLEDYGHILGQVAAYQPAIDEKGRVFMGTYPGGFVVMFEPETKAFHNYGQIVPGHAYVRSLAYDNGFLYAGTMAKGAKLVCIDASAGTRAEIPPPPGKNPDLFECFYTLTVSGRYLFAYTYYDNGKYLFVYHLDEKRWLDVSVEGFGGLYVSPPIEGKVYFCVQSEYWSFDLYTHAVSPTGLPSPANGKGFGVVHRNGSPVLHAINHTANLSLLATEFNRKTTDTFPLRDRLKGGALSVTTLESGSGGALYMGGYMSGQGCAYYPETGEFKTFPIDQAEGMVCGDGCMYFGVYPGGRIYRHSDGQSRLLRSIGEEQDRPFVMLYAGDTLYIGSVPDYNRLGGALTVYSPKNDSWEVFRNIVPNQSVTGLAYQDGLIYGSTGIWGGLGIKPAESEAALFIWDCTAKRTVHQSIPQIPGIVMDKIGAVSFGPDGLLWCIGRSERRTALFAADPQTLEVRRYMLFDPISPLDDWRPTPIRWGVDNHLYTCIDGVISVDIECLKAETLAEGRADLLAFGSDDRLYYCSGPFLRRIIL
jgi:hypothetical protein